MQRAELDKLLKLTAIELEPEQVPVFLDYFSSMKKMFDEFYNIPLVEEGNEQSENEDNEKYIECFTQGAEFANAKAMLENVEKERLVGNAIEVKSAFGE
jgi:Asp-tRNA(Asn)/Glu-tRNA(Gln) amidotransferase C subunit